MIKKIMKFFIILNFLVVTVIAQAKSPETVPVGNPGNAGDTTGYGMVAYEYRIGKYEVTNAEYCEFLNGVAATDTYELYDVRMGDEYGGIYRYGSDGSFTYSVQSGREKRPVVFVNWLSAIRYCNWLTNGQKNGDTESGCYKIKFGSEVTLPDHKTLVEGTTTSWVMASENEWYKAAYYDPTKSGGAGYWTYAMKGGSAPACNLNSNESSDVGVFASSPSPYGTFDQNGNVWEFNESMVGDKVGLRGGSFWINDNQSYLVSSCRYDVYGAKWPNYGFRIVALGLKK